MVPPFWSFSGAGQSGVPGALRPGLERPPTGMPCGIPGIQEGGRPGPQAAGAASGV